MPELKLTSLLDGTKCFIKTINNNLTHCDYDRVTELADDYLIYLTGTGVAKKLKRFTPRETQEMFNQRVRLTQSTTPDVVGSCMKPMFKVGRAPAMEMISWGDSQASEKNKKALADVANSFYGNQSVNNYLTYRMVELDTTDPNSFIVVEFTSTGENGVVNPREESTLGKPYPFEVNAHEAINFCYENNILQWLIVKMPIMIVDKDGKQCEGAKYTVYLAEYDVVATQIHKTAVDKFKQDNANFVLIEGPTSTMFDTELHEGTVYLFVTKEKGNKTERYFSLQVHNHKIPFVPAQRVGTIRDLTTRGRTRVPLIHQAKPYLEKLIKTISEFDLTNCLHVFPQKIQYSDRCAGYLEEQEGTDEATLISCLNGMTMEGKMCKQCHGTGYKVHKSAADLIQVAMPKDIKDMVSLENFLVYKYPPIDLLDFQRKLALYEFRYLAQRSVYNSEVFSSEDIMTATEKKIDLDSVYDTLKPYADNYSEMYVFIMECIASIRDMYEGFEVIHAFPNDFKMKPYSELLSDYQIANANGAPSYIKKALTRDISRKLYIDQPDEILRIETKEKYFPFPGKSDAQISFIMSNDGTSERIKIFFNHFDMIFSDLEYEASLEGADFYKMEEKLQREKIKAKTDEYVKMVQDDISASAASAFNPATTEE